MLIEMQFELLMCLFIHLTNGNMTFVKEYTTAKIICPLKITEQDNVSWYYDENKPIALMNVINPEFKFKYRINNLNEGELSINVYNFTENDEGKYSCQGIVGGEHKEGTVTVSICRMSDLFGTFSQYINGNLLRPGVRQRHTVCSDSSTVLSNRSDIYDSFNELFKFKYAIKLTGIIETTKDKLRKQPDTYICFTVNEDQCIISDSDSEFYIKVEWVSREELDNNELYIYTCTCNSSSAEENLSCKGSIDTYYLNNTLLLNDLQMTSDGTYQCLLAQNKTDNQSTIVRLPKWDLFLTYGLKIVMIVCGIPLCFAIIRCVKKVIIKSKSNPNQVGGGRIQESELLQEEGYSSIDRRRNIQIGKVSYTANRVSMPSHEDRTCVTSVATINSQPGRTKNVNEQDTKKIMEGKMNQEPTDLNYIEVEFSQETAGKIFFIHGSDNGTPYADIDLTIKADPLPESDSSADEDPDAENNFMTLADIQKLREKV